MIRGRRGISQMANVAAVDKLELGDMKCGVNHKGGREP